MAPKKRPTPSVNQNASGDKNLVIGGDVVDSVVISGDNNTVNVNRTFIQRVSNFFTGDTEQQRDMRNRRAMLELVKNAWIKGVLEKSLYNEILIQLDIEERPDAVAHPWDVQLKMPDQANRILPSGASMMDVFDEINGAMLILGEPGSGKTTMLLELARDCITRAQHDDNQPIPVVFNLSSWDGKQSIDIWLTKELSTKYNVPKKTAQKWVVNDSLQLLLDGLDEVALDNREACIKAINEFRQEHGLAVPIAICSRIADYEALKEKINLSGAILLRPLIPEQIDGYLSSGGSSLAGLRQVIKSDAGLQELAQSPLMLGIMSLAYRGLSADELADRNVQSGQLHTRLLDAYVNNMFARTARTKPGVFSEKQTIGFLSWLSQKMTRHNQAVFLIDQIQPSWLQSGNQQWSYIFITRLAVGLIVGFAVGQFMSVFEGGMGTLGLGLLSGIAGGMVTGLVTELRMWGENYISSGSFTERFLKKDIIYSLLNLLTIGLSVGAIVTIVVYLYLLRDEGYLLKDMNELSSDLRKIVLLGTLIRALIYAVLVGLSFGILFGLRTSMPGLDQDIKTAEALSWSLGMAKQGVKSGLYTGLIAGIIFGLIYVPIMEVAYDASLSVLSETDPATANSLIEIQNKIPLVVMLCIGSLLFGILGSIIFGTIGGLAGGIQTNSVQTKTRLNEGLRLSGRNALIIAVFVGLPVGAVLGWLGGLEINGVLRSGLMLGLLVSLWYGGLDLINHYILLFILYFKGHIPRDYAQFLDYCVDRIFLRKVGGGYIFIHRLLMEHFAEMYVETPTSKGN